jgi:hypothetical protein
MTEPGDGLTDYERGLRDAWRVCKAIVKHYQAQGKEKGYYQLAVGAQDCADGIEVLLYPVRGLATPPSKVTNECACGHWALSHNYSGCAMCGCTVYTEKT